jgi:2'-hydroxyisoflavone reductase
VRCDNPAMRVLVLGATAFVGRHIVEAALARGADVTLFDRGREARLIRAGDRRRDASR